MDTLERLATVFVMICFGAMCLLAVVMMARLM